MTQVAKIWQSEFESMIKRSQEEVKTSEDDLASVRALAQKSCHHFKGMYEVGAT